MDFKQIQELIRLINKSNIGEITVEEKGFKITIKQKQEAAQQVLTAAPMYAHQPMAQMAPPAAASNMVSSNTETITGTRRNPRARKVAISRARAATAEYIVLSAPKTAPMAMMAPTVMPRIRAMRARPSD